MLKLKSKNIFFILTELFIACYVVRALQLPLPNFILDHLSNFAITGCLVMACNTDTLLIKNYDRKKLLLALLPFVLLNIVVEFFVRADTIKLGIVEFSNFNTPDPLDAVFGIASVVLIYWVVMHYSTHIKVLQKKNSPN